MRRRHGGVPHESSEQAKPGPRCRRRRQRPSKQRHGNAHAASRHTHGHSAGRRGRVLRRVSPLAPASAAACCSERCSPAGPASEVTAAAASAAQVSRGRHSTSSCLADTPRAAAACAPNAARRSPTRRCVWDCVLPGSGLCRGLPTGTQGCPRPWPPSAALPPCLPSVQVGFEFKGSPSFKWQHWCASLHTEGGGLHRCCRTRACSPSSLETLLRLFPPAHGCRACVTEGTIAKIGSADKLRGLPALQPKASAGSLGCAGCLMEVSLRRLLCSAGMQPSFPPILGEDAPSQGLPPPMQDQQLVRQRFGGLGKAPRKTGVHGLFGEGAAAAGLDGAFTAARRRQQLVCIAFYQCHRLQLRGEKPTCAS